jgi:hypothetical protein
MSRNFRRAARREHDVPPIWRWRRTRVATRHWRREPLAQRAGNGRRRARGFDPAHAMTLRTSLPGSTGSTAFNCGP